MTEQTTAIIGRFTEHVEVNFNVTHIAPGLSVEELNAMLRAKSAIIIVTGDNEDVVEIHDLKDGRGEIVARGVVEDREDSYEPIEDGELTIEETA